MSIKKISDGIFDAAPAVLFVTCTVGAVISGVRYIITGRPLSRMLFTANTAGVALSTVLHLVNKVMDSKPIKKDDAIDIDVSKAA